MTVKVVAFLFYLLLLLLPTQLGRHFFFDFSLVSGIRNDYLAPTIYLTDIIIFFLIILAGIPWRSSKNLLFILCYLFSNTLVVAESKWVALYKLVKIVEFALLGSVIVKIRPKIDYIIYTFSVGVFYSSLIAIVQFWQQKSIGGLLYWLGERSFTAASPGIAAYSAGGRLILRPYATFPHPNVLGGFLAIILPSILFFLFQNRKKLSYLQILWFSTVLLSGFTAILISFSRTAWFSLFAGMLFIIFMKNDQAKNIINKYQRLIFSFFLCLMAFSVIVLFIPRFNSDNWVERINLAKTALRMVLANPFFGVGLNNLIVSLKEVINPYGLYVFQPVHNIYLLILAELGLLGFSIFLALLILLFRKILSADKIVIIALSQLFLMGMFDHYLWTLQQGQLLLTIFISLAFLRQKNYA